MQWYRTKKGRKRLKKEVKQMQRYAPDFSLYVDDQADELVWRGHLFGHEVLLVYAENHPFREMKVYVLSPKLPDDSHHVFSDGSICYVEPEEWHPEWTALAVLLTAIRFLDDYKHRRLNE